MNAYEIEKRSKAVTYQFQQFETTATKPDSAFVNGATAAKAHGRSDEPRQSIRISDADREAVATALGRKRGGRAADPAGVGRASRPRLWRQDVRGTRSCLG